MLDDTEGPTRRYTEAKPHKCKKRDGAPKPKRSSASSSVSKGTRDTQGSRASGPFYAVKTASDTEAMDMFRQEQQLLEDVLFFNHLEDERARAEQEEEERQEWARRMDELD